MKAFITRQTTRHAKRGAKRPLLSHVRQATTTASAFPDNLIHFEHEVQQALANGEPVVALESTIIGEFY